jgi:hypothetical protein
MGRLIKTFAPRTALEFRLVIRMCFMNQQANHAAESPAISEYARKHRMTYAEAWGLYQREKKAAQAQPASV